MTERQKVVYKLVKQMNEKIARIGRKYGADSLIYERNIERVKVALGDNLVALYGKITGAGYFAIDQKVATIINLIAGDGSVRVSIANSAIQSLAEYNPQIRSNLRTEDDGKSGFSDVFTDWYKKKYGRTQEEEKERIYSNMKESVKKWLDKNAKMKSGEMRDNGWRGYMTYYEMYEIICKVEGLDPGDLEGNPHIIAGDFIRKPEEVRTALQSWALELEEESKKHGIDPFKQFKPTSPRG